MKHLLGLKDLSRVEIEEIINLAQTIKKEPEKYSRSLDGKTLAMLFQKTSTRTRVSFETAMTQLGGHAQYLDWRTTNFTLGDLRDEIKCLARYADAVMARVYKHENLEEMIKVSEVPIISGLSNLEHPCQVLGDLLTIKEKKGGLDNLIVAYIGDGNNVCNSLIIGCSKVGIKINASTPKGYKPADFAVQIGKDLKMFQFFSEPEKAVENADIIYTDTWVSMGEEAEKEGRLKIFPPYQVNRNLMNLAPQALFMHCLPAHRGFEVTDEVLDSDKSIVYDQAENRLHVQKSILLSLIKNK